MANDLWVDNKEMIQRCAQLAKLAYHDSDSFTGVVTLPNTKERMTYTFYDIQNLQMYVYETSSERYVTIRGTDEKEDIKTDLSTACERDHSLGVKGHKGFIKAADDLSDVFFKYLTMDDKRLFVVGHSLGGAIAKILVGRSGSKALTLVTFGEPRSVKRNVKMRNKDVFRVVNNCDIVCRIPPWFKHGVSGKKEQLIYINRNGRIVCNPVNGYIATDIMYTKLRTLIFKNRFFDSIKDHYMKEYIQKLED